MSVGYYYVRFDCCYEPNFHRDSDYFPDDTDYCVVEPNRIESNQIDEHELQTEIYQMKLTRLLSCNPWLSKRPFGPRLLLRRLPSF